MGRGEKKAEDMLTKDRKNGFSTEEKEDWSQVPFWTSQRFLTSVATFWGFAVLYFMRINLSIAMVCMVTDALPTNTTALEMNGTSGATYSIANNSDSVTSMLNLALTTTPTAAPVTDQMVEEDDSVDYCAQMGLTARKSDATGEFTWSKELQGFLLGSFFWGYLVLQVPGGVLSERYGPKRVVFWTMAPVAVLSVLSPISARLSPWLFLVVRVLIGVGEGSLYPAGQAVFTRWSPPSERSRLLGFALSGGQFGNALIFPMGGILCSAVSWDSVFYVTGGIGMVWAILWWFVVFDSPELNPRISDLEKRYIQAHVTFREGQKVVNKPWKAIFTSIPFWAILIAHTCGNYGLYMMLTQIPTYMKEVLKFDLKSNGAFSMLPYLCMWFCITMAGSIADTIMTRGLLSRLHTRKLLTVIGLWMPAACMIGVTFMDCTQQVAAVVLLCGAVGLSGIGFAGYLVNHGDIAPPFAGTMFGITNVSATIPGILAPYIVGAITTNKTRSEWQVAFFIAAAVYFFGGLVYLIFAKAHIQKWVEIPDVRNQQLEIPEARGMISATDEDEQRV